MADALRNVGTPVTGIKEVSELASPSGTAHWSTTVITVNDDAIVDEWQNNGTPVHRLKGDGRAWFRVLAGAPVSPVAGDLWIENDGVLGYVIRIRNGSGTTLTYTAGTSGDLQITASAALLQGHAVRGTGGGLAYAAAVVGQHKITGVMQDDVAMGDPGTVMTNGAHLTLPDWSLLTGAATLTVGSDYWLSATPGRYTTTFVTAAAARVGRAISSDTLVIDTSLCVLG